MKKSLDYIQEKLCYDMTIDGIKYHGTIDYVTDHIADGDSAPTMAISDRQPADIADFVSKWKEACKDNPELTIEQFYESYSE